MSEPLIEVQDLEVSFGAGPVLDRVSLQVRRGEIVTLIGPNGSGKTTLVRTVLGLVRAQSGRVRVTPGLRIGYMPQHLRIDAVLPLTVRRFLSLSVPASRRRLEEALRETGAGHVLERPVQGLSGGELQRVMLARALLRDPDLLVLDEPVQGVDVSGQNELYELIARVKDRHGCGVLMVSHDLHLVMAATDHVVCLNHHVCCSGHPEAVSRHPAYLELFGTQAVSGLAVYTHHHDHRHDVHGDVVPLSPKE